MMARTFVTIWDMMDGGKTHLAVKCRACRVLKHVPLRLLPMLRSGDRILDLPARMKCERCGQRPDDVQPVAQSDAYGNSKKIH